MGEQLLTVAEIAAQSRVSEQTIRKLCIDGTLPAVKIGRRWLVPSTRWHEYLSGDVDVDKG